MTAQCPNCGSTNVNTFTPMPDMDENDELDCNDCGRSYEYNHGNWMPQ